MRERKMKPKRTQRHTEPNWQGKGGHSCDKRTLGQAKHVSSAARVQPFAGKVFYLDLPSNRIAETLESDIKELGGTVEKFFSKEIKYLVSNKREARYVHCLRQDSPVPSPDSGQSSPHLRSNPHRPGSHGESMKSRSQGQTDTFITSRGKSLVERVVKEQERVQMNKMLSNALEWGVKILYVDDVMAYVKKKKKIANSQASASAAVKTKVKAESSTKQDVKKCKGGRIGKPFIKVEDSSRHYRPIYLTMPDMPEFNLKTGAPCSPFAFEDKDPPGNKQRGHRGVKASASEEKAHGRKKNRDKKRGGYCECCLAKYDNLTMHLQSERHKAFSKSKEYVVVDRLISTLYCNFIHIKTKVKRPKCSASSVLIAPGPLRKTDLRHKGDLDPSETVKEEKHCSDDECEGSYSGHKMKIKSAPDSALLTHRDNDQRSCYTYSARSKQKYLSHKRQGGQNSLTSCTEKVEQAHIPQFKLETAPSRGEFFPSLPSRVRQVELVDKIPQEHMNNPTSHFLNMDIHNEVFSGTVIDETKEQEESEMNKDAMLLEADQDRNIFSEKVAEKHLSEKDEGSSPMQKIQRKIKDYKRKRRKVDTNTEHVKQSEVPNHSLLKLWELFQSSDDMEVEFHGFED